MNVLLWALHVALAVLYLAGGSYKVFKFDELATCMRALPRSGWRALGVDGRPLKPIGAWAGWVPR